MSHIFRLNLDTILSAFRLAIRPCLVMLSLALMAPAAAQYQYNFILSAPPRESLEESRNIYEPIAQYLSGVAGLTIEYRRPENWLSYREALRLDAYDIVFDEPHFVSYRIEHHQHVPLVKTPGEVVFAVLARKNDLVITEYRDLAGRTVCGEAPPHLGTMRFLEQFKNPLQQPKLIPVDGWRRIYNATLEGRCYGGIVPVAALDRVDKEKARILYLTGALPGPAFTAGRRISAYARDQIVEALTSWQARLPTQRLRARYGVSGYVPAGTEEYVGLHSLVDGVWRLRQ